MDANAKKQRGRPRVYANAAEKQRAYRARKRQQRERERACREATAGAALRLLAALLEAAESGCDPTAAGLRGAAAPEALDEITRRVEARLARKDPA